MYSLRFLTFKISLLVYELVVMTIFSCCKISLQTVLMISLTLKIKGISLRCNEFDVHTVYVLIVHASSLWLLQLWLDAAEVHAHGNKLSMLVLSQSAFLLELVLFKHGLVDGLLSRVHRKTILPWISMYALEVRNEAGIGLVWYEHSDYRNLLPRTPS